MISRSITRYNKVRFVYSTCVVLCCDLCNYTEAFEDFLKSFKSTTSSEATDALSHLNIEDEEVELVDTPRRRSARNARGSRRQQAVPEPKLKYMEQLQEVANRERSSITIELEDLKQVCTPHVYGPVDLFLTGLQYERTAEEHLRLVKSIEGNTAHYTEIFSRAIDSVLPAPTLDSSYASHILFYRTC